MEPNITPTVLLYNLICDREWFCDNSDGEITTKALMNIVKQCFAYDVDELKVVYKDVYDYAREKCKNKASDLRYELGLPIFTPSSLHLAMYCALPLLIRSMMVR